MFLVLFLLFTGLPIAEIYILIKSGDAIGVWNTVYLVLLSGFVGAWCVRAQAAGLVRKLNLAIANGQVPGDELIAALCVFVGGVLMIAPGFITDILGILLVVPPTRFVLVKILKFYFARMVQRGVAKVHVYSAGNFGFTKTNFDQAQYQYRDSNMRDVTDNSSDALLGSARSPMKDLNQ